ncbi:MAG: YceD family protein [Bifidobacteriaceae bacterium]|jgi:uncharacterized protein|nr:YceD family protein [Bifidobacteriaceae bacterium]
MPELSAAELGAVQVPELICSVDGLSRQPGTSKQLTIDFEAPAVIGTAVIGVPEGEPVELELLLESVLEGVLTTGTVRTTAVGECGRCLEEVGVPVVATFQELFQYPERAWGPPQADQGADEDRFEVVDDTIDLNRPVTDAVVLSLPFSPLCRDDCEGLCPDCGARLADQPGHGHQSVDARWAVLEEMLEDEREEI